MANAKEAKARIKINKLLEEAGWRFFDDDKGPANIQLEPNAKITKKDIDAFGEDFESTKGDGRYSDSSRLFDSARHEHLNEPQLRGLICSI